jgi:copper transport protein
VIASVMHLPTLSSLWDTSYGQAILVKAGILLAAMVVAAVNLLRTKPILARPDAPVSTAVLLRRLVGVETLLVVAAVTTASVLSSLPPPPKALASLGPAAHASGSGPTVVKRGGYTFALAVTPNRAVVPNTFRLTVTRGGQPVRGADVTLRFDMLDMTMESLAYTLPEVRAGVYERSAPAFVMVGRWGLTATVTPAHGAPVTAVVIDRASG